MNPMGRQGFNSPDAAESDARHTLSGIPFAVLSNGNDFGWVVPLNYAKKLIGDDIHLVWEHHN